MIFKNLGHTIVKEGDRMAKVKKGPQHEGREELFVDVDRMMNEGLAGGTVNHKYEHPSVDYSHPLEKEEPPRKI